MNRYESGAGRCRPGSRGLPTHPLGHTRPAPLTVRGSQPPKAQKPQFRTVGADKEGKVTVVGLPCL